MDCILSSESSVHRPPTALDHLTIRRAVVEDAPALATLFRMVYKDSSHPFQAQDAIADFLVNPCNFQIVAYDDTQLIASMAMAYNPWNDSYELGRALTHAGYRRHGLAARLMQDVVDYAAESGRGELLFGFPRVRRIVELCADLQPRMIVVGHDAGRNVANGGRETHAIVCGILRHGSFVHVAPASRELLEWQVLAQRIYAPLALRGIPGPYPEECFVGGMSQAGLEVDGWVFDYSPASRAIEIIGSNSSRNPAQSCTRLNQLLTRLGNVEHVTATVLADKGRMIRALTAFGFQLVAYLPAWYKVGQFRFDCVQLARRLYAEPPREQDFEDLLRSLDSEFQSSPFLQQPNTLSAAAGAYRT